MAGGGRGGWGGAEVVALVLLVIILGGRATRWMQGCGGLEKQKGKRSERVRLIETRQIQ